MILERAFPPAAVARMRAIADEIFAGMPFTEGRQALNFEAMFRSKREAPARELIAAFNRFADKPARDRFPNGYCFLLRNCGVRRSNPANPGSRLALHFDANFLGDGDDARVFNFWVPLVDVGETAPGLTLLDPEVDQSPVQADWRRHAQQPFVPVDVYYTADDIERILGREAPMVSPATPAGSVVPFDQMTLHATQVMETGIERTSIEFRICDPERVPEIYLRKGAPFAVVGKE